MKRDVILLPVQAWPPEFSPFTPTPDLCPKGWPTGGNYMHTSRGLKRVQFWGRVHRFYEILTGLLSQKIKSHNCRGEERHSFSCKAELTLMSDTNYVGDLFRKSSILKRMPVIWTHWTRIYGASATCRNCLRARVMGQEHNRQNTPFLKGSTSI